MICMCACIRMYQEEYHKATAQAMLQAVEEESVAEPDDSC